MPVKSFLSLLLRAGQLSATKGVGDRIAQERRLKAARDKRDIDQKEVAKAIGVTPGAVSRWENELAVPKDDVIAKLAAYFGVRAGWLRYGEGERIDAGAPLMELQKPQRAIIPRRDKGKG